MLTEEDIIAFGYSHPRQLPDGKWIAVMDLLFTTGLFYNLDRVGYECRWCYEKRQDAIDALNEWNGEGEPSGDWIVRKGG